MPYPMMIHKIILQFLIVYLFCIYFSTNLCYAFCCVILQIVKSREGKTRKTKNVAFLEKANIIASNKIHREHCICNILECILPLQC